MMEQRLQTSLDGFEEQKAVTAVEESDTVKRAEAVEREQRETASRWDKARWKANGQMAG